MFLFTAPKRPEVDRFLLDRDGEPFSYPEVGATLHSPPSGYTIDHNRQQIGNGKGCFERAQTAIRSWRMFDLSWVELVRNDTPLEVGRTVAIVVRHFGFYSLNAARIVYTIDEPDRFGFAYGTLREHGEIGEERFMVEYDAESGDVWYDLFAFSRPGALLAKLGYPLSRYLQEEFAFDSKSAMLRAVEGHSSALTVGRIVLK